MISDVVVEVDSLSVKQALVADGNLYLTALPPDRISIALDSHSPKLQKIN